MAGTSLDPVVTYVCGRSYLGTKMKIQYPYFDLEGKVGFRGGGNDTTVREKPAGKGRVRVSI